MKKLLFLLCFLPSLAFAIDKPIPCTGNSCKLLFETTGAGGAKVSAGNVDGLGKWTIGASGGTQTHSLNGAIKTTLDVTAGGVTNGGTFVGLFVANLTPAATTTCESTCDTQASSNGFVASQATCLAAWNSTTASTCADATNAVKFCLCAGLD